MTRALILAIACLALPGDAEARPCSSQLLASTQISMPPGTRHLDLSALSCNGLAQVYFIVTGSGQQRILAQERQLIEAVFRREGLIR